MGFRFAGEARGKQGELTADPALRHTKSGSKSFNARNSHMNNNRKGVRFTCVSR